MKELKGERGNQEVAAFQNKKAGCFVLHPLSPTTQKAREPGHVQRQRQWVLQDAVTWLVLLRPLQLATGWTPNQGLSWHF